MNKLTKLILATAVLATSGFSTENVIDSEVLVNDGGKLLVSKCNTKYTVGVQLGSKALLFVDKDRTADFSGASLNEEDSKVGFVGVLGTLRFTPNESTMPILNMKHGPIRLGGMYKDSENDVWYMPREVVRDGNSSDNLIVVCISLSTLETCNLFKNGDVCGSFGGKWDEGTMGIPTAYDGYPGFKICGDAIIAGDWKYATKLGNAKIVNNESGVLDLSDLNAYAANKRALVDLSDKIIKIAKCYNGQVKLPYNCKFGSLNLADADEVCYDYEVQEGESKPGVEGTEIVNVTTTADEIYGDYANSSTLGVTLPSETSKIKGTKHTVGGSKVAFTLANIMKESSLNSSSYSLDTSNLEGASLAVSEDTAINFGLKGSKALSITGNKSVTFAGNNESYAPGSELTLPNSVKFTGTNSLFGFTQTYKNLSLYGAGANNVKIGSIVTVTNGLNVENGHALTINGVLVI